MKQTSSVPDDERRLLALFRSLPTEDARSEILQSLTRQLMEEFVPEKSIYDFMPEACGVVPRGGLYDAWSVAHVIYCGAEETGEPFDVLTGSSHWDEEEAIPRFVNGAERAALEQGSFFSYDEEFARDYLYAWRWEIVNAIRNKSSERQVE